MNAASETTQRSRFTVSRLTDVFLASLGAIVVSSTAIVAIAHVDDRFEVSHVSGTWMALAQYATERVLYPPLFDGSHFGGTRYMPLGIVLNAGASRVSGEYLVSGKVISYAGAIALFALTFALTRRISRSWPLSLALVGTILVTGAGSSAVHAMRGDTLPATLQLGAIALVLTYSTPAIALAGVLCALAFMAKFSALWALAAITLWLFIQRRPRLLALFLGTSIVATASLVLAFDAVSDGRMTDNVYTLAFAGTSGRLARREFTTLLRSDFGRCSFSRLRWFPLCWVLRAES